MAKTGVIRIDDMVKRNAEKMFEEMGLSISTAVEVFLRQSMRSGKIPFEITVNREPNEVTYAAMDDAENNRDMHGSYNSVDELMEDLNA